MIEMHSIAQQVLKVALTAAKSTAAVGGLSYVVARVFAGKRVALPESEPKQIVQQELRFAGEVIWTNTKEYAPAAVFFAAGKVVTPVNAPVGVALTVVGAGLWAVPIIQEVRHTLRDLDARKQALEAEAAAGLARAEHDEIWDQLAEEDGIPSEVQLGLQHFTELDLQRFLRTPGKSGGQFARELDTDDPVKLGIARRALIETLREHNTPDNKITQALAGFDREVKKDVA